MNENAPTPNAADRVEASLATEEQTSDKLHLRLDDLERRLGAGDVDIPVEDLLKMIREYGGACAEAAVDPHRPAPAQHRKIQELFSLIERTLCAEKRARRDLEAAASSKKRTCVYVPETALTKHGYVPSIVTEGEPGHSPLAGSGEGAAPWYWGHDLDKARAIAMEMNEQMGLTERDVLEIVLSSMNAQEAS
jgi:hypothetical protein